MSEFSLNGSPDEQHEVGRETPTPLGTGDQFALYLNEIIMSPGSFMRQTRDQNVAVQMMELLASRLGSNVITPKEFVDQSERLADECRNGVDVNDNPMPDSISRQAELNYSTFGGIVALHSFRAFGEEFGDQVLTYRAELREAELDKLLQGTTEDNKD